MLITVCSPGRSPGASSLALATALTWPGDVTLAECDPAGGTSLTGACLRFLPARGLIQWAVAVTRGADPAAELNGQLLPLDGPGRLVLALPPGPAPLATLAPHWGTLATALAARHELVIADIGRIGGTDTPVPVLAKADRVLLVTRPAYTDLTAAASALRYLAAIRTAQASVTVLLTGPGPYRETSVARELAPAATVRIPHDPRSAQRLRQGIRPPARRPLSKAAAALAATLSEAAS